MLLKEVKNGRNGGQLFNDISNICGNTAQVEQSITRNVYEGLDWDTLLENIYDLSYINMRWTQEFLTKSTFKGWE